MQLKTTYLAENGLNLENNKKSPEHFISKDFDWELDSGTWSVLKPMNKKIMVFESKGFQL